MILNDETKSTNRRISIGKLITRYPLLRDEWLEGLALLLFVNVATNRAFHADLHQKNEIQQSLALLLQHVLPGKGRAVRCQRGSKREREKEREKEKEKEKERERKREREREKEKERDRERER